MKRILLLAAAIICSCAPCYAQSSGGFSSYYDGKFYESKITPELLERSPAWPDGAESPPLSPRRALGVASGALSKLAPEAGTWRIWQISLRPVRAEKWVYLVEFAEPLTDKSKYDGPVSILTVVVLMNGEAVEPNIRPRQSP